MRGVRIWGDLVKAVKVLALEKGGKLYEVMEEAKEQSLDRRQQGTT